MVKRCVGHHYFNGSKCEQCQLKYERKNPLQIEPLTDFQKEKLREFCKNVLKEEGINN